MKKRFEKLKNGDTIKIKGNAYEVMYVRKELAPYRKAEPIRECLAIYLHDNKHPSIFPTHVLKYYFDTKEMFLTHLITEKIEKEEIEVVK